MKNAIKNLTSKKISVCSFSIYLESSESPPSLEETLLHKKSKFLLFAMEYSKICLNSSMNDFEKEYPQIGFQLIKF